MEDFLKYFHFINCKEFWISGEKNAWCFLDVQQQDQSRNRCRPLIHDVEQRATAWRVSVILESLWCTNQTSVWADPLSPETLAVQVCALKGSRAQQAKWCQFLWGADFSECSGSASCLAALSGRISRRWAVSFIRWSLSGGCRATPGTAGSLARSRLQSEDEAWLWMSEKMVIILLWLRLWPSCWAAAAAPSMGVRWPPRLFGFWWKTSMSKVTRCAGVVSLPKNYKQRCYHHLQILKCVINRVTCKGRSLSVLLNNFSVKETWKQFEKLIWVAESTNPWKMGGCLRLRYISLSSDWKYKVL